jgi:ribose transport system substrate-binding protein
VKRLQHRYLAGIAVAVLIAVVAAGCGSSKKTSSSSASPTVGTTTGSSAKPARIAFFLAATANTYSQAELKGAQAIAKAMNAKISYFDGNFETEKQVNQIEDAITSKKYDAFIVSPNDGASVVQPIQQALKKGIKVACVLTPCGKTLSTAVQIPGQTAWVGISFEGNGHFMGNETVRACAKLNPCKVAVYIGLDSFPADRLMLKRFEQIVASHPNIKVVQKGQAQYLADPAFKITQNVLQANPDLNVVVTSGDQMTNGAEQAINKSPQKGKVVLIGSGASTIAVNALKQKRWLSTYIATPYQEGQIAAKLLIQDLRGANIYGKTVLDEKLSNVGAVVNQANASKFTPQWPG